MFPTSWLFVPGNRPDRFGKALASGAQAVIVDCEDAVAPAQKDEARAAVVAFLGQPRKTGGAAIAVRINPLASVQGLADLAALAELPHGPDFVVVPKAEAGAELALIGRILDGCGSCARIVALVETARGVAVAADLAAASPRLAALMFGAADYAGDLGKSVVTYRPDFARAMIVNAAAAGGLAALDSPWFDMADQEGLSCECRAAAELGFHAKAAIHPSQIAAIDQAFAVSEGDRELARRYIEAGVDGVGLVDGMMVDVAMLNWARRIV